MPTPTYQRKGRGASKGRAGRRWRALRAQVALEEPTCWRCGNPFDHHLPRRHPDAFTVDHVIPLSKAPWLAEVRANLRAAHHRCNAAAGNRMDTPPMPASRRW